MPPKTNTTTGTQADPNSKDFQEGLLRELVSAESDPANDEHIKKVSEAMRLKMNQVLIAAGVTSTLGQSFLHNPGGNNIVEVRENISAKEFVNAVNFVSDEAQGYISAQSRKQLFDTLNAGLAPTRIDKPVTVEEEVGEAVRKSDEADAKKKEAGKDSNKDDGKEDDSIMKIPEGSFFWDRWAINAFNKLPKGVRKKLQWLYKNGELLDPWHDRFAYKLPPKKDK